MYAVVRIGGRQYRVKEGQIFNIERIDGEKGSDLTVEDVLAVGEGDALKVGEPTLAGAKVGLEILEQGRGKKILVLKFKRRKNYKRLKGHRQYFTRVRVKSIQA